ncbi:hypothetical protein [Flavobacterium aquidurense]|uniref:hypothetical protein n=1 Tax=Flavobacterium aquidurense TaxID=362413 RepID=UPI0028594C5D|nr:hypothetical protein [Flavobacterium aquidurense]MDR7370874.1 hypothetical protein [Flavobacterium aquidurense]
MEKLTVILFFFLFPSSAIQKNSIDEKFNFTSRSTGIEHYRQEINRAFSLLKKQKRIIDLELNTNEKVQILSVAFPEIIRYDAYSDYLETSSNRLLYVNKGKDASDFSTGYFQMKPSFLEDLENYVANNESLKSYNWILIQQKNEKEVRKERIKRLENFQWQLKYLKVFWYVGEYKYQNIDFKTQEDKIRFFATAYNYGFTKPENEITKYQSAKKFSPGEITDAEKLAFADFSIDFIKTYAYFFNQ